MTLYITPTHRLTNLRDVMERMVGEAYGEATPSRIVAMSFCEPRSCRLQLSS